MKILCAWCGKDCGEKPPLEDKGVTSTICPECNVKYFPKINWDLTDTDMPFYNNLIAKPSYYEKSKGVIGEIKYVSPQQYMELAAKTHNSTSAKEYAEVMPKQAQMYADRMKAGDKFPIPVIDFAGGLQEGRHRVKAAEILQEKLIPVLIVNWAGEGEAKSYEDLYARGLRDSSWEPVHPERPRVEDIPRKPKVILQLPKNAVVRTDKKWDGMVRHLGYEPVSFSAEQKEFEVKGVLPTDIELIAKSQEALKGVKIIPDKDLSPREMASLQLARAIANDVCLSLNLPKVKHVWAANIPPASERRRTAGLYGRTTGEIFLSIDQLQHGRDAVDTSIHETAHHITGPDVNDGDEAHYEAISKVGGIVVQQTADKVYDSLVKNKNFTW